MDKCHQDVCCFDKCHLESWHLLKIAPGTLPLNKTEVESVQLGNTYIADMDKCPQDKYCLDKCRGDSCNLLYMLPGPFV